MAYRLIVLDGVLPSHVQNLAAAGIKDTTDLLKNCGAITGREHICEVSGIPLALLTRWARRAELMRIAGVGNEYAQLLEESGIETLAELGRRDPAMLCRKLVSENEHRRIVKSVPYAPALTRWVAEAKRLKPAFELH